MMRLSSAGDRMFDRTSEWLEDQRPEFRVFGRSRIGPKLGSSSAFSSTIDSSSTPTTDIAQFSGTCKALWSRWAFTAEPHRREDQIEEEEEEEKVYRHD